jgi:hypothetical protein
MREMRRKKDRTPVTIGRDLPRVKAYKKLHWFYNRLTK